MLPGFARLWRGVAGLPVGDVGHSARGVSTVGPLRGVALNLEKRSLVALARLLDFENAFTNS